MSNETRLRVLRDLIDEKEAADNIHNEEVRRLYERGGCCLRYFCCTSEGSEESANHGNPSFFVGDLSEVRQWLGSILDGGSAEASVRDPWVCDLDNPRAPGGPNLDWLVLLHLAGK